MSDVQVHHQRQQEAFFPHALPKGQMTDLRTRTSSAAAWARRSGSATTGWMAFARCQQRRK